MQQPRVGVGIIIHRDGQILLIRRKSVHGAGTWSTPGGHLDPGEAPEACAAREAMEETGVAVSDLRFVAATNDVLEDSAKHYITLWFRARYGSGDAHPRATDELSEVAWFRWKDLPQPLFKCFENLLAGRCYPPPAPHAYAGDHAARVLLAPTLDDYEDVQPPPKALPAILADAARIEFTLSSDLLTGSLLRTLAASKPAGRLLEIGTGCGVGTAWLLDGMDASSHLITIDLSPRNQDIARKHLGADRRIQFILQDAIDAIAILQPSSFDLIFADSYIGKHRAVDEVLALLKPGGFYLIDDMLPVHGWGPDLHRFQPALARKLVQRDDLRVTRMCWSTGLVLAVKVGL